MNFKIAAVSALVLVALTGCAAGSSTPSASPAAAVTAPSTPSAAVTPTAVPTPAQTVAVPAPATTQTVAEQLASVASDRTQVQAAQTCDQLKPFAAKFLSEFQNATKDQNMVVLGNLNILNQRSKALGCQ